jgi:hypothetical protein
MCLISAKYFEDLGWVLAKNLDLTQKPTIRIRKSFRRDIERLYIWVESSKFTEGINEYGVAIISASVINEKEGTAGSGLSGATDRIYYSPEGLRIRTALFERSAIKAIKKLIDLEITGNTIVADKQTCFVLEASYKDEGGVERYIYQAKEVLKDQIAVRTNHGIMLPFTGYNKDIPNETASRNSSEIRYEKVVSGLVSTQTLQDVLEVISNTEDKNPQLNPLKVDEKRGSTRTVGQLILVPGDKTLHFRPVWCEIVSEMDSLNKAEEKTYFEVISNRKLLSLKECLNKESFNEF